MAAPIYEGIKSRLDLVHRLFGAAFSISRWYIPGHDGIDLPAKVGTPIRAVASGRVSYARDSRTDPNPLAHWALGGGNVVNIDVGNSMTTQYAHLNSINVRPGQVVHKGDIIGTVGSTGGLNSAGNSPPGSNFGASHAHLHFGLWDHRVNRMIEPTAFLSAALSGWNDPGTGAASGNTLGAWGDHVRFPVGHILTADDVDNIIRILRDNGFFASSDPLTGAIGESVTRDILMRHVGEPWGKPLQETLQREFLAAANEAVSGTAAFRAVGDFLGKVADPANWVRILALLAGGGLVAFGAYGLMRSTGTAPTISLRA